MLMFLFLIVLAFAGGLGTGALLLHMLRGRSAARPGVDQIRRPGSPEREVPGVQRWQTRRMRIIGRRIALVGAPLATNALYASVALSQGSLHRIDPVIFVAFQMAALAPVALVLLWYARSASLSQLIRQGLVGGVPLSVGFVCVSLSLRTIGIVPTAMLTAIDGIVASIISWLIFRQRQPVYTCLAALFAGCGAVLLWWVEPSFWQTDVVALFCGLLFTVYAFHVERSAVMQTHPKHLCAFFGGLLLSMALVTIALALCFGSWPSLNRFSPADLEVLLYASIVTVLIPVVISTILLRYISAVTLAFCAVLEPLVSIAFAYALGTLSFAFLGWLGVGCILMSVLVQAGAAAGPRDPLSPMRARMQRNWASAESRCPWITTHEKDTDVRRK